MKQMLGGAAALALIAAGCATTPAPVEEPVGEPQAAAPSAAPVAEPVAPPPAPPVEAGVLARVEPPFAGVSTIESVLAEIRAQEGLRLEAYTGPAGTVLIGYGHAGDDVSLGMTISEAEAEALLRADIGRFEDAIRSQIAVPVNENEFSAMVHLAYNIGTGNFAESSVRRLLNEGDRAGAADAFLLWNKVRENGALVESPHLTARRQHERALFLTPERVVD